MVAQTLAQLNNLSTESMLSGVVDEVINLDPLIRAIPFEPYQGTQRTWVRESTLPTPEFYESDEILVSGNPTFTQVTLTAKNVGIHSDLPGQYRTRQNVNEQRAINIMKTMKGVMEKVGDRLIYGNATTTPAEFNGLHALVPSAQNTAEGTSSTGGSMNLSNLDAALDKVKNGNIELLLMNRNVRRRLSAFVNSVSTTPFRTEPSQFGFVVERYQNVPLERTDRITMTETIASGTFGAKTGGDTTSIFGLMFGPPDSARPGVFGVSGPMGGMPELQQNLKVSGPDGVKDVIRDVIVWYLGVGLGSTLSIMRVDGILDSSVSA